MAVAKFWGEERLQDVVYAVYLRKVRYVPPSGYEGLPHYRSVDPDKHHMVAELGPDLLQWETIRERIIRYGTEERLVESLIGPDNLMDSRHFNVFFATYRAFADCSTVLRLLLKRYEGSGAEPSASENATNVVIQNSIRSILLCWIDMYPEDFYEPSVDFACLNRLIEFSRLNNLVDVRVKAKRLYDAHIRLHAEGGPISRLPSVSHYVLTNGYERTDASSRRENTKLFDVGKENCVQIAEQLTFWDAELFKELLPQHCQGCFWSRRHKKGTDAVYTVKATIDQFNAVAQRVMTSVVLPECKPDFRAKIISKWIDIARELRALKNFSSLKAVLSSLQSEPVYRLKSSWANVPSRSMAQFRELASIFSVDDDGGEKRVRKILEEEGTAKSSPLRRPQLIQSCRRSKSDVNLAESQGTVPYLGSFLTDLTMIDQAHPDYTEDGLINFEKRRKEFEVLAKIRLFQSAARAYTIPMDSAFCSWFQFLPALSENQCFSRSLEVEKSSCLNTPKSSKHTPISVHKINTWSKFFIGGNSDDSSIDGQLEIQSFNDSGITTEDSRVSEKNRPQFGHSLFPNLSPAGIHMSSSYTAPSTSSAWKAGRSALSSEFNPSAIFRHQRSSSASSNKTQGDTISHTSSVANDYSCRPSSPLDSPMMISQGELSSTERTRKFGNHLASVSRASNGSSTSSSSANSILGTQSSSFYLARVALDDSLQSESAATNYKCIKVDNGDKLSGIIDRVLEKHIIEGDTADYCLVQLLPDGCEFQLPDKCNPFYAVAPDPTSPMLNFVLRRRIDASERPTATGVAPSVKKLNRRKRNNLLRWSSGYL